MILVFWLAHEGHETAVKVVLNLNDRNTNTLDKNHTRALLIAA